MDYGVHLPYFNYGNDMEQSSVKLLAYSWHGDKMAGYIRWHKLFVEKVLRFDLEITHLALQIDDLVYHSFSGSAPDNRKAHWVARRLSDRVYEKPKYHVDLGYTDISIQYALGLTAANRTPVWTVFAWFYSFGLLKIKKDCVSTTRHLINYMCPDIPTLKSETTFGLLKELERYGCSRNR